MDRLVSLLSGRRGEATIFDILLQERFRDTLRPAFDYMFTRVFLPSFPNLAALGGLKDEVFLFVSLQLQAHYLHHYGGTFEECMHGWRRLPPEGRLLPRHMLISLIGSVFVPYLKRVVAEYTEYAESGPLPHASADGTDRTTSETSETTQQTQRTQQHTGVQTPQFVADQARRLLNTMKYALSILRARPMTCALLSYEVLEVFSSLLFASGSSPFPSLLHWLGRMRLGRAEEQLQGESLAKDAPVSRFWRAVRLLLVLLLVALKVLEWYYASSNDHAHSRTVKMPPKVLDIPPPAPNPSHSGVRPDMCPICRRRIVAPATLPTGYAYCIACLLSNTTSRCPVTGSPYTVDDIRRIFT